MNKNTWDETMSGIKLAYVTTVPFTLNYFRAHIAHLKAQGVEVHAISSPEDALERFGDALQIDVHPVAMTRSISPIRDLRSGRELWRVVRKIRPDIIHTVSPKAGLLGPVVARLTGVPVVLTSIFGLPQMTRSWPTRKIVDTVTTLSCRFADRVWCDSFSLRDHIVRQRLCPAHKLIVLGQGSVAGVDAQLAFSPRHHGLEVRRAIRQRYDIPDDARVLGFVGRLVPDKGMHELATAWRDLREEYPNTHLLLVGPFEANTPLGEDDLHLFETDPRVHLAGHRQDIAPHLAAMDIVVMPSYREGFGIANIEASAMALPIVATRIPGCVDSVQDGVTGILVPPRDAAALAEATRRYLDDAALCLAHGQAGRNRVLRDFRPAAMLDALYQEYVHLLGQKVPQPFVLPLQPETPAGDRPQRRAA